MAQILSFGQRLLHARERRFPVTKPDLFRQLLEEALSFLHRTCSLSNLARKKTLHQKITE